MASPHQTHHFENNSCLPCGINGGNLWEIGNTSSPSRSPNNSPMHEVQQTEDILSNELSKLSVKERSEAYDDLHCVGEELKETPDMIQKSLLEFDQAIRKHRNAAYDKACKQNKAFVEDPSFRLKFLRAKMHNVDKAVRQMMKFLQYKGEYFGEDKIARDITLADLTEEDIELMLSGLMHIQAERDRMGRVVVYSMSKMCGRFQPESTFRVLYIVWYNALLPLLDVQMKGLVGVYLDIPRPVREDDMIPASDESFRKLFDAGFSLPVRNSALHFCLKMADSRSLAVENALIALTVSGFSPYTRVRTRIHYGTIMELQYQLWSYGISADTFPVDMDGNLREDILNTWCYEQQAKEGTNVLPREFCASLVGLTEPPREVPCTKAPSIIPTDSDVLSGRGRSYQNHPGNLRFRKFVEAHMHEYDALAKRDKLGFIIKLTNIISTKNVRFLKQTTSGEWVILDPREARKKVGQLFRSTRKKI